MCWIPCLRGLLSSQKATHRKTNSGFALVETIAATTILTFALAGLMVMVQYARARTEINYHDRYVTLRTDGELQKIRSQYSLYGNLGSLQQISFKIPQLDENALNAGKQITVTVTFTIDDQQDMSIGSNIRYTAITALAEWKEHQPLFARQDRTDTRYIQLREDYYYERTN